MKTRQRWGGCILPSNVTKPMLLPSAPAEVAALWEFAGQANRRMDSVFAPDHFNYLFHMNLTPHVHMHIYPRYQTPRLFAGQSFTDTRFGDHYDPQEMHYFRCGDRVALTGKHFTSHSSWGAAA